MKKALYLKGSYQNQTCRIEVCCYPRTPSMKAVFRTKSGGVIPLTQNLGSPMPLYQCVLIDELVGPGQELIEYAEANSLGYIADYKWFHYDSDRLMLLRIAVVFQFSPERLREIDPQGCRQYEEHNAKLLHRLNAVQKARRKAS